MTGRLGALGFSIVFATVEILASTRAAADVGRALEQAATFDPTVRFDKVGAITFEPLLETRWVVTESGGADGQTVAGFSVPRARLKLTSTLFDAVTFRLRIGSSSDGAATFQQAYAQATWKKLRIRAGQIVLVLNAGEEPSAEALSSVDFSAYANTFAGGETQGVDVSYDGPVRFIGTIGNGARAGFSELLSPLSADVAVTGRVELYAGASDFVPFESEASFPRGQKPTLRLGVVGHVQTKREIPATSSAPATPRNDIELAGGDLSFRGSGFSLIASGSYLRFDQPDVGPPSQQGGVMLFGSVFLARRVEVWSQLDAVWPVGRRVPLPAAIASGQPGTSPFRTLSAGASFYVVPGVHRLKIQADARTMFDGEVESIVPPSSALGILAARGAQVGGRVQLVAAL